MASTTTVLGRVARTTSGHVRRRSFHSTRPANAILMPAISPMMTEGSVTRWHKKEGETFAAGEVLLQIQSGFNSLEVQAELPGVLGKILFPEGSKNVPVEHVIALVARDKDEFARSQFMPTPPPAVRRTRAPSPMRSATSASTPLRSRTLSQPMLPPVDSNSFQSVRNITSQSGEGRIRLRISSSMCTTPLAR